MTNKTYINAEQTGHPVKIVLIPGHLYDFGNNSLVGPLHAKLLYQLLQILGCSVSDCINCKTEFRLFFTGFFLKSMLDYVYSYLFHTTSENYV